jgi:hypothetical protein
LVNAGLNFIQKLSSGTQLWQNMFMLMNTNLPAVVPLVAIASAVFLAGCASSSPSMVLAPVGPPPQQSGEFIRQGILVVFSAFDTGPLSPQLPDDTRQHSGYELRSEKGELLQVVPNHAGPQGEDPAGVSLPAGKYRIVARANGYGLVTVPVLVAVNQVTTVHLEGGASWQDRKAFTPANCVRLPDGEIVGWKAVEEGAWSAGSHVGARLQL